MAEKKEKNPYLSLRRPSERKKVQILEETVCSGTLEDLKAVLNTYAPFEMTARALALAGRYRGIQFVRELFHHGASFGYTDTQSLQRKYKMCHYAGEGVYFTEYYLLLIPQKHSAFLLHPDSCIYTPMLGTAAMGISDAQEKKALSLAERVETVRYLAGRNVGLSLDEMLFWALCMHEVAFADALIQMGAGLKAQPEYYARRWDHIKVNYLDVISSGGNTVYRKAFSDGLAKCSAQQLQQVLKRYQKLASAAGRKVYITQDLFERLEWTDQSLALVLNHFNCTGLNQKTILEAAVSSNSISALKLMGEAGWLNLPSKREAIISFARRKKYSEPLAWLLDFQNRTFDVSAEEEKKEKRLLQKLNESPDSVSALQRIWGYKTAEDGTLVITSYKGKDTDPAVPAVIGKKTVSTIGSEAFSPYASHVRNSGARVRIKEIRLPEGIREISSGAFRYCKGLETVELPASLEIIGNDAFYGCTSLKCIRIPPAVSGIGSYAFFECRNLTDLYLPDSIKKINRLSIDMYSSAYYIVTGKKFFIHLVPGSRLAEYFHGCENINVIFDYE